MELIDHELTLLVTSNIGGPPIPYLPPKLGPFEARQLRPLGGFFLPKLHLATWDTYFLHQLLQQPDLYTVGIMASALRLGTRVFRSSTFISKPFAQSATFNGVRCYSTAKTQVKSSEPPQMRLKLTSPLCSR